VSTPIRTLALHHPALDTHAYPMSHASAKDTTVHEQKKKRTNAIALDQVHFPRLEHHDTTNTPPAAQLTSHTTCCLY
ncbi:hypothetical protein COCCADRAFT_101954, partial [Bipolaris zeicola 26-R-13]